MNYFEFSKERNEFYGERLELVMDRINEMVQGLDLENKAVADFFKEAAEVVINAKSAFDMAVSGKMDTITAAEGEALNAGFFDYLTKNYETSFANPTYAVSRLGEDLGKLFSSVMYQVRAYRNLTYFANSEFLCISAELLVELFTYFETEDEVSYESLKNCLYSFSHDYFEIMSEYEVHDVLDPKFDQYMPIIMEADLSTPDYLYRFGEYITANEIEVAKFLNTLSDEEIQSMADTFTEGYRIGFATCNKDISKKSACIVRYPIGFERMIREAVKNLAKIGIACSFYPLPTAANKQYSYDHKEDDALILDKALVEYRLECFHNALDSVKDIAPNYGGPAVVEVFGEEPFAPVPMDANPKFSKEQQELQVHFASVRSQYIMEAIHGEERSFTIIAYPIPAIGDNFKELFAETVKLNTLDYVLYRDIQQRIIDVLDTADKVHIVGTNGNKTDLYVNIFDLQNPDKETAFENCVADVNIPVGEVFTSPVLEGTNGKLHVKQVFLNELNYLNFEMDFKDGMIESYTCTNFQDEEENKKYINDNVLHHHETLPMGEFAIGTNTTAYKMARQYNIGDKLPILIAEKTGPHFAVGDTCYSYDEDNITYNSDGKAIVARDNSVSILRKTDISKAYFNCHTDITIPYDELGAITVIKKDGSEVDIIRNGRFVLEGTEELNKPLDEIDAMMK